MKDHRVNKLAKVRAEMAHLKQVETEYVRAMKESGPGTYEGDEHYVVITEVESEVLDMKAVKAHLSRQFKKAHTKVKTSVRLNLFGYKEAA